MCQIVLGRRRKGRYARTCRELGETILQRNRYFNPPDDPLKDTDKIADGVIAGEQQQEFIAAGSRHDIATPDAGFQRIRNGNQHIVACGMTEPVIDILEQVQIQRRDRKFMTVTNRCELAKLGLKPASVQQARQRVGCGHMLGLAALLLQRLVGARNLTQDSLAGLIHEQKFDDIAGG